MFTLTVYAGSKLNSYIGFRLDSDQTYNLGISEIAPFVTVEQIYYMQYEGETVEIDLLGIVWNNGEWLLTGIDKAAYEFELKWDMMVERHAEELTADDYQYPADMDDFLAALEEFDFSDL